MLPWPSSLIYKMWWLVSGQPRALLALGALGEGLWVGGVFASSQEILVTNATSAGSTWLCCAAEQEMSGVCVQIGVTF